MKFLFLGESVIYNVFSTDLLSKNYKSACAICWENVLLHSHLEIEISFKFIPKILMSKECIHFLGPLFICRLATGTGCLVLGSNPYLSDIFRTRPDRPCDPPSHLHVGYWFIPGGKVAAEWPSLPPIPSRAKVKERGEL